MDTIFNPNYYDDGLFSNKFIAENYFIGNFLFFFTYLSGGGWRTENDCAVKKFPSNAFRMFQRRMIHIWVNNGENICVWKKTHFLLHSATFLKTCVFSAEKVISFLIQKNIQHKINVTTKGSFLYFLSLPPWLSSGASTEILKSKPNYPLLLSTWQPKHFFCPLFIFCSVCVVICLFSF